MPVARRDYWTTKFGRTVARDSASRTALERDGWTVIVIWECQLRSADWLAPVRHVLEARRSRPTHELGVKVKGAL
jgi:G:T-mismatch repair DNA endonuclease (very short patch repair protein)